LDIAGQPDKVSRNELSQGATGLKYRSRTEILCQILDSAKELDGLTKTKIMFQAFLSYRQLGDYLSVLLENGLLEYDAQSDRYKTTEKGMKMLETYQKLHALVGDDQDSD
jgi:predicted transcriptional regulator